MNIKFILSLSLCVLLISACQSETSDNNSSQSTNSILIEGESPEVIAGPFEFTEGPYWHPDGYLLFSDIPANRIYRWVDGEEVEVFLEPSGNSNGIQADLDGSILLAQHRGSLGRVTEGSDEYEVIVENFEGEQLNSPNDLVVHSNGTIFFTDPPFGADLLGRERELDFSGVYKLSTDGELSVVYDEFEYPNGIVFNSDESILYVNDSGTGTILAFEMDADGNPQSPTEFANMGQMGSGAGAADGMVTDSEGNLYSTGPRGLTILDENGEELHVIEFEEQITNLEWGGENLDHLFITGSNHVYRLPMNVTGNKKR